MIEDCALAMHEILVAVMVEKLSYRRHSEQNRFPVSVLTALSVQRQLLVPVGSHFVEILVGVQVEGSCMHKAGNIGNMEGSAPERVVVVDLMLCLAARSEVLATDKKMWSMDIDEADKEEGSHDKERAPIGRAGNESDGAKMIQNLDLQKGMKVGA